MGEFVLNKICSYNVVQLVNCELASCQTSGTAQNSFELVVLKHFSICQNSNINVKHCPIVPILVIIAYLSLIVEPAWEVLDDHQ